MCARAGRKRAAGYVWSFFAAVGLATLTTGFKATALFVGLVGTVVAAVVYRHAPDVVFTDPDPTATITTSSSPGMTERDVFRHLAIHVDREELKEEKLEKRRKRQERKRKNRGF